MNRKNAKAKDNNTSFLEFLKRVGRVLRDFWLTVWAELKKAWRKLMTKYVKWVDPKFEKYREKKRANLEPVVVQEQAYTMAPPETREELFALLREAPMSVLNGDERKAMSALLSLPDVPVSEIMTKGAKIVFVNKDEILGPLVLDKLYRSGFTFFPVIDGREHIIGTLHTALLNSLDIKDTKPAREVMEPRVYYLRGDYSLEQALKAFLRTGSQVMLVVDKYEKLIGMLTFVQLMEYVFNGNFFDDFDRDEDRLAVAKRRTKAE